MSEFADLGVHERYINKLEGAGISAPTAVQRAVIPAALAGGSVIFRSETGTGKTLAYLLPLAMRAESGPSAQKRAVTKALAVAPTYELASQIKAQVRAFTDMSAALCIGGAPIKRQIDMLREHPDIVIGGPARILELIHLKKLKAESIQAIVLDEADRLLSPEMRDDTKALLARLPRGIQIMACSATMPDSAAGLLDEATGGRAAERVYIPQEDVLRKRIAHWALFAQRRDKIDTLRRFLAAEKPRKALVFTSKLDQVENIASKLRYRNVECMGLHSRTDKAARKAAIDRFRSGKCPVLITSDLTSRGLDIAEITHIVQMDLPSSDDFFVHRAGRTARAGLSGINVVIGDEHEMRKYAALERRLGLSVEPKMLYKGAVVSPADVTDSGDAK